MRTARSSIQADHARTIQKKTKKEENIMSNNNGQKLAGKVAVVTGGSRGIGAAVAMRLATDGAKVAITYTKEVDAAASGVIKIEPVRGKAIGNITDECG